MGVRDPSDLIPVTKPATRVVAGLTLEVDVGESLPVIVADNEAASLDVPSHRTASLPRADWRCIGADREFGQAEDLDRGSRAYQAAERQN